MTNMLTEIMSSRVARMATWVLALFLSFVVPAFSQTRVVNSVPAAALSSTTAPAPKGAKVLAQVPLDGQPVIRMFTQSELGRTYLYLEHGSQPITALDVTNKRNPQVINRQPAKVEAPRFEELSEGGTIEVSSAWEASAGYDSSADGRGAFSVLHGNDPDDPPLLEAFGRNRINLIDPDRHLIFFASSTQLLVVEDGRWKGIGYTSF